MAFEMSERDRNSEIVLRLSRFLTERLSELRRKNDLDNDLVETANLRGRIAESKFVYDLLNEQPLDAE